MISSNDASDEEYADTVFRIAVCLATLMARVPYANSPAVYAESLDFPTHDMAYAYAQNVIGSSDCGFASFAATEQEIHPSIVWAKFANLAEGARIASRELW